MDPGAPNDGAERVAVHFTIIDRAKEGVAVLSAQGDIIYTGVRIIGGWMAQGVRTVVHGHRFIVD